jgi:sugar phosphate isomerase/epimerase
LNELGEKIQTAGFQLGYHNHDQEFMAIDNTIPYDVLMARTDPKLVRFQIDVGNLTFAGADALAYLHKYPTRYFSMHAKDYLPGKTSVPVGQGILNWKEIFKAAKQTPIENYFAEVAAYGAGTLHGVPANAWPTDSIDQLRQSYIYLHQLRV